jgi:uncharacterized cofD-like protein
MGRRKTEKKPRVVVIGGGTGVHVALTGLREFPVDLTAVVSMADSGGSNRVLRDEFGILPTSDIRQCLVALASNKGSGEILRQLFTYRFHRGTGIAGMTFGNLFMAALTDVYKDQLKAIRATCRLLGIKGRILPVSLADVQLVARYQNGHQVVGEHAIDEPRHDGSLKIVELETIPEAKAYPKAVEAIEKAALVVVGPGDLYTSLICNLVVRGISQAIKKSKAKKAYVLNLISRWGQTYRFTGRDHLKVVEKYLGRGVLDFVLVNKKTNYPVGILKKYAEEKAFPVKDDLGRGRDYQVIRKDLVSTVAAQKRKGDKLRRSIIRHDPQKLAKALMALIPG